MACLKFLEMPRKSRMYTKYTLLSILMKSTKPDYKMVSNGTFIQDEILLPRHSIHVFLLGTEFW